MTFLNSRYKNQYPQFTILIHVNFTIHNPDFMIFYNLLIVFWTNACHIRHVVLLERYISFFWQNNWAIKTFSLFCLIMPAIVGFLREKQFWLLPGKPRNFFFLFQRTRDRERSYMYFQYGSSRRWRTDFCIFKFDLSSFQYNSMLWSCIEHKAAFENGFLLRKNESFKLAW